jgi:hypothetical protein
MKITKDDLSRFILQVAERSYSRDDWQRIAVNHYSDEKMEEARRKLVRYVCGYAPPPEQSGLTLKELLHDIIAELAA